MNTFVPFNRFSPRENVETIYALDFHSLFAMGIFRLNLMILSVFASLALFQAILDHCICFVCIFPFLFRSSLSVLPIIYNQNLRFIFTYSKLIEKVFKQRFCQNEWKHRFITLKLIMLYLWLVQNVFTQKFANSPKL